ncbi:MAG: hypothetical protein WAV27_09095 [Xanthobacteraceae bacterium]
MYAFLLTLGAVIIAAGLGLIASGFSFSQHSFDATNVTPGIVAITGGCILVGLAFVVRALLRVEHALTLRPISRPASLGEVVGLAAPAAQVPLPGKAKVAPPPMPIPADIPPAAMDQTPPPAVRIPALESASIVQDSGVSLLPNGPLRVEDESVQMTYAPAPRLNGAGHAKTAQRVAVSPASGPRRPQGQPKGSLFDSLWPKAQRGSPEAPPPAALQVVPPLPAVAPQALETAPQPVPAVQEAAAATVSILKSGVVEGMAYTLYSDGSIEAQLPGGTLRFGSITELRNHIEQNS